MFGFLVLCACWSTTWYAIRLCLRGYPPLMGASLRFVLAAVFLAVLTLLWRNTRLLSRAPWRVHLALLLAGVVNGAGYACLYLAERTITGGTAAVISAASPFFTMLVARMYGLERFVPRRLLGVLVGFVGVAVMMADGLDRSSAHLSAMLLVAFASAALWPLYGALLKRHAGCMHPFTCCTYFLGYTSLTLLVLALVQGESMPNPLSVPLSANLGLLYLALVGSVLAWTVYMWLLSRLDLTVLATTGLIQPVLALGVDWLGGDTELRMQGYVGAALVIGGVSLAALRFTRGRRRPSRELRPAVLAGADCPSMSRGA